MKRWRKLLILAAVFVAGVLVTVLWPREKEPEYQGRKLSEWLEICDTTTGGEYEEAVAAVRAMGTNCLPFLVKWATPGISKLRSKTMGYIVRKGWYRKSWYSNPKIEKWVAPENHRMTLARRGLEILGRRADPAIPELTRRMNDYTSEIRPVLALEALTLLKPRGVQPVAEMVTNTAAPAYLRNLGLFSFCFNGPGGVGSGVPTNVTIPALLVCLTDKDPQIRSAAQSVLSQMAPEMLTNGVNRH